MTRSVHDNFMLGYEVDSTSCTMRLRTEYRDQGPPFERTDIVFSGVEGYLFRDNLGGILFDVVEEPIEHVVAAFASDFEWGTRYGWPWASASADRDPCAYVREKSLRAYTVQSAIGFDGFVVAESMVFEPAT